MPPVVRGSRAGVAAQQMCKVDSTPATRTNFSSQHDLTTTTSDPCRSYARADADQETLHPTPSSFHPTPVPVIPPFAHHHKSSFEFRPTRSRDDKPEQDAYYDSRAATTREFRRRATNLEDYYKDHPELLPQLPFTWKHGWPRYILFLIILLMVVDACIIPITLYYAMTFAGHVQGWIVFAVVASIWGVPTYVEFAYRSWKLIKKEAFYRPLHTTSRWSFDITTWIIVATLTAVTAFLIVGSAPHEVWLRVLSMPAPAILYVLGGTVFLLTLWHLAGWNAPFRISSTVKGDKVYPGVYYLVEDVMAVNVGAGRPWREALAARYAASPRFRTTMLRLSLFWSIPALLLAGGLTAVAVVHTVNEAVAYGVCWGVPFVWAAIWAVITVPLVRQELQNEADLWEADIHHPPPPQSDPERLRRLDSPDGVSSPPTRELPNQKS